MSIGLFGGAFHGLFSGFFARRWLAITFLYHHSSSKKGPTSDAENELCVDFAASKRENARLSLGGVPEWPKGSDCKSDGSAFGGSNPPPSTNL